jgi:hypothetical protein
MVWKKWHHIIIALLYIDMKCWFLQWCFSSFLAILTESLRARYGSFGLYSWVFVCVCDLLCSYRPVSISSPASGGLFTQYRAWKPLGTNWRNQMEQANTANISVVGGSWQELILRKDPPPTFGRISLRPAPLMGFWRSIHGETNVFDGDFVWFYGKTRKKYEGRHR